MNEFIVETITFTNPVTNKPVVITKSQELSGVEGSALATLVTLTKALGLQDGLSGTYSVQVTATNPNPPAPVTTPASPLGGQVA